MSPRRHLILSAVCIASLSAGPALAAQGRHKASDGRPGHAQKNKPSKEDKARGKHTEKKDRDDRDRERSEDDRRGRSDDDRGRGRSDDETMRFRGLDRNNDGVITRAEWRGNDRSFANHDWNRDGVLSGDEVRPGATRPGQRRY